MTAAGSLLEWGAHDDALSRLRDVLAKGAANVRDRISAAAKLAEVGLSDEALAALHAMADDPGLPFADRVDLAVQLGRLGRRREAADALEDLSATTETIADTMAVARGLNLIVEFDRAADLFRLVLLTADATSEERESAAWGLCATDAPGVHDVLQQAVDAGVPVDRLASAWAVIANYGFHAEAADFLQQVSYDRARQPTERIAAVVALADSGSWLGEALVAIRDIQREADLEPADVITIAAFLDAAGEWRDARMLLDTLDVDQLDDVLAKRLVGVPVSVLFYSDSVR